MLTAFFLLRRRGGRPEAIPDQPRQRSPVILILFRAVGGAGAFGLLGLFIGPTLLAVGYELIREWNAVEKHDVQLSFTE